MGFDKESEMTILDEFIPVIAPISSAGRMLWIYLDLATLNSQLSTLNS